MVMRSGIHNVRKQILKNFFNIILAIVLMSTCLFVFIAIESYKPGRKILFRNSTGSFVKVEETVVVPSNTTASIERSSHCSYHTCFNPYNCGKHGKQRIQIYVYPLKHYETENRQPIIRKLSKEFYTILQVVKRSKYYTPNPHDACLYLPAFDTLSCDNFMPHELSQALNTLPYWNDGENHIIFNLLPLKQSNAAISLSTGNAIIAGAGFDSWTYRPSFDVSLPPFVPISNFTKHQYKREWLVTVSQVNIHSIFKEKLRTMAPQNPQLVILQKCTNSDLTFRCRGNQRLKYPDILQKSKFCVIFRGSRLAQPMLLDSMASGCVPILLADTLVMPFHEVIDWKRAALFILEENLHTIVDIAKSVSPSRVEEMSEQCLWLYSKYFSSMEAITNVTLDILNQRVFPEHALFYEDWNLRPNLAAARSPLFLRSKSYSQSFTAVILAYDRIDSLFVLIEKLALVPSLSMMLVIWNNQRKSPPPSEKWPRVNKPVKVIRTNENKLSNRFLPFKEIQTEAILSLDDDISMLTEDELDFGFEVWREFPDRIVGFPSRNHIWDNSTLSWRYESEWTNEISMILTGASFYHKYWHYVYSTTMPAEIRRWVDEKMNCEDIAMNFLVANMTNKAPIKVAPRKKFKCPECTNTEMLSADLNHMKERSKCINKFSEIFGHMPLQKVEFRADPVLYKDSFPAKLKKFKNIGNL